VTLTLTARQNPFVLVNPRHMGQLWTNLISNAIKYTPAGGSVRVSWIRMKRGPSERLRIQESESAPGIAHDIS